MNATGSPHAAELCLQELLGKAETYVRREPMKAVVAALGAGLLIKLLPPRAVVRPITALAVTLLPPALLGFGILKAFELCYDSAHCKAAPPSSPDPDYTESP
jgi:hypothetical protein